jgi:hypothetical protein
MAGDAVPGDDLPKPHLPQRKRGPNLSLFWFLPLANLLVRQAM